MQISTVDCLVIPAAEPNGSFAGRKLEAIHLAVVLGVWGGGGLERLTPEHSAKLGKLPMQGQRQPPNSTLGMVSNVL
jgi:hypothetical protein